MVLLGSHFSTFWDRILVLFGSHFSAFGIRIAIFGIADRIIVSPILTDGERQKRALRCRIPSQQIQMSVRVACEHVSIVDYSVLLIVSDLFLKNKTRGVVDINCQFLGQFPSPIHSITLISYQVHAFHASIHKARPGIAINVSFMHQFRTSQPVRFGFKNHSGFILRSINNF